MQSFDQIDTNRFITEVTTDVFETILAISLESVEPPLDQTEFENAMVVGSVSFAGKIRGVVHVQFGANFARTVTGAMLGMDPGELGDDDIDDTIGEFSNMIGGGFNSKLNDSGFSCQLSVPTVLRGSQFKTNIQDDDFVKEKFFRHAGDTVMLTVSMSSGE